MVVDHFAGRLAEHYDEFAAETFDPAAVEPVVDLLADLAGDGAATTSSTSGWSPTTTY